MTEPKVSVITSVWNHAETLPETVEGIINQTYDNWEYIILAEPSPDDTIEVAKEMAGEDERIKVDVNESRLHLPKSLNKGLKMADGDYVAINDADDVSTPKRLETQVSYMEENPNTVLTCQHDFYARNIDANSNTTQQYFRPTDYHYAPESGIFPMVFTVIHSSFMYRNIGQRYREKFKHSQEVDMYCRCLGSEYDVEVLLDDLVSRRIHSNQKQNRDDRENKHQRFQEIAVTDWFKSLRGWGQQYDRWSPDLPYEVEDHSPHKIMY